MSRVNPALRQQISQAYVSHRLNNNELVAVTRRLAEAENELRSPQATLDLLQQLTQVGRDQRDPVATSEVQQAIGYLRLDSYLERLSDDKPWTPFERALYRRLSNLENDPVPAAARPQSGGSQPFVDSVNKHFATWDLDGNGALSALELDRVLANPELSGEAAAAAVVLRRQGAALETCSSDPTPGVTQNDLEQFIAHGVPDNSSATAKINLGYQANCKLASLLQPAGPLLDENFDAEQVEQGRAASCVLLSTQASLAADQLRSMFEPLADGMVNVHFADGQVEKVRDLTLAERLYHAKGPAGARWPGLMEAAVGQRLFKQSPREDGSFRSAANNINPEQASLALHGQPIAKVNLDEMSLAETRELLTALMDTPKPWLAGSRKTVRGKDSEVSIEDLHNGITNSHAYSIKGFDADSDEVWLRNPWRQGEWVIRPDGRNDGVFSMPLRDFYSSYRWVSVPSAGAA